MSKSYSIKTLQDIIDCTNEENLDRFMTDLSAFIESAHFLRQIASPHKAFIDDMIWVDDGKHEVDNEIRPKTED